MHIVSYYSYMAHTEICNIIIKGALQCILCLWRESDGRIKRVLNSFCCDSSVDDAAYVVLLVSQTVFGQGRPQLAGELFGRFVMIGTVVVLKPGF